MSRHDKPTLNMIVQGGRLVPGGIYEQEVLDTYPGGAEMIVVMHQKRSLPLLKKYWAVLRDVVDNCPTPWGTKEEASDALKVELGVTDVGKTRQGNWFVRPGSIAMDTMDEPEFRRFYDGAMAILAELTGIDPESLRDRYKHIPEQDSSGNPQPAPAQPDDSDAGPNVPPATGVAPLPGSDQESGEAAGAMEAAAEPTAAPAADDFDKHRKECIDKMLATATDKTTSKEEAVAILADSADMWLGLLGPERKEFVTAVFNTAKKVLRGELTVAPARKYLAGLS